MPLQEQPEPAFRQEAALGAVFVALKDPVDEDGAGDADGAGEDDAEPDKRRAGGGDGEDVARDYDLRQKVAEDGDGESGDEECGGPRGEDGRQDQGQGLVDGAIDDYEGAWVGSALAFVVLQSLRV